ncbi:MAG TPA: alternative ribosome rescue aminoacyl-tRNA hydrolase ArfB [Polyangiaceae bacterium]|jgi:ribosome-associated protein|nr:alternative ribosome rescue aminoacyl-tRNA hydrolase ArfB [Polyangiaceae bacterium]
MGDPLFVSPALTVPANELRFTSVRASGPGGQNVNKVSSKVELRFDFERSKVVGAELKTRLRVLARGRLDAEGQIFIASQATRDRQRNLEDARQKLLELLVAAGRRPKRRRPTKPSRGATETRLREKRHQSDRKRDRGSRADSE